MLGEFSKPLRILHVLGGMNRGGVETWLMHVLRHIDRERFQVDFMVHTNKPCAYDHEIRSLGSQVIPCLSPSRPWQYARNIRQILMEHGPYDIVHSHVHHYSGFVLWQAHSSGVPIRIAHSHNDTSSSDFTAGVLRRVYLSIMERLIRHHATIGLACSQKAAVSLFGVGWDNDPRWRILLCSINLQPFTTQANSAEVRAELGIAQDAFVVGHVGRFSEQKNHAFLVDIVACLVRCDPNVCVLLIGDGPLRPGIEAKVARLGLSKYFLFAGLRADVPRLLLGAMDVFLLPSLYEGLPLVLLEAQSAGLPCVFSNVVSNEADVVMPLICRLSLEQPAQVWAEAVLDCKGKQVITKNESLGIITKSLFNIEQGMQILFDVYGLKK